MTKKLIIGALPLLAASVAFGQQIQTTVNGDPVHFNDVQPMSHNGRVLVPVRGVFEKMGVNVEWSPANRAVYATGNNRNVTLYVGKTVASVDGRQVALDVPPMMYHGRTMVPLRFISESMGAVVDWNPGTSTVAIQTTNIANVPPPAVTYRTGESTTGVRTQPMARTVVLRANTVIPVTLNTDLSSKTAAMGDRFTATVDTQGNGDYMGLPEGTKIQGHVQSVRPMSSEAPGVLGLAFDYFLLPDGRRVEMDGTLIGLDSKSVKNDNGRLIAVNKPNRDLKYVGIGAGAGALIAVATKGNVVTTAILGAALGYLYDQNKQAERRDVNLNDGSRFGIVLDRDQTITF